MSLPLAPHEVEQGLARAFGTAVHWWPAPLQSAPRWWQWRQRRHDRRIAAALRQVRMGPFTQDMRDRYWQQVRRGQLVSEDAGGFCWRCWCAALELPYEAAGVTYSEQLSQLLDQAAKKAAS